MGSSLLRKRAQIRDLKNPMDLKALNDQLDFVYQTLLGNISEKSMSSVVRSLIESVSSKADASSLYSVVKADGEFPETPNSDKIICYLGANPTEWLQWTGRGLNPTLRRYAAVLTGIPISFTDLSDNLALGITVKTVASQAGSGTASPDNIRAIGGKSAVTVKRTGKNVAPLPTAVVTQNGVTYTPTSDGKMAVSGTGGTGASVCNILGALNSTTEVLKLTGKTVSISGGSTNVVFRLTYYDGSTWTDKLVTGGSLTFAIPSNCVVTRVRLTVAEGVTVSETVQYQVEIADAATSWEAYAAADTTLTPSATLYGLTGYEDEIGNDGHETHKTALFVCRNTSGFSHMSADLTNTAMFQCTLPVPGTSGVYMQSICSHAPRNTAGASTDSELHYVLVTLRIRVLKSRLTGWSDSLTDAQKVALFNTWLEAQYTAGTPVQAVYQLATAATTTGTATTINGNAKANVITSDGFSLVVSYAGSGWACMGNTTEIASLVSQLNDATLANGDFRQIVQSITKETTGLQIAGLGNILKILLGPGQITFFDNGLQTIVISDSLTELTAAKIKELLTLGGSALVPTTNGFLIK